MWEGAGCGVERQPSIPPADRRLRGRWGPGEDGAVFARTGSLQARWQEIRAADWLCEPRSPGQENGLYEEGGAYGGSG